MIFTDPVKNYVCINYKININNCIDKKYKIVEIYKATNMEILNQLS